MKRNRKRFTQLSLILFLISAFILLKNQYYKYQNLKPNQPYANLEKAEFTELKISDKNTISIYKKNKSWFTKKNNIEFPADQNIVDSVIDAFINFKKSDIVSGNKSKHTEFGIVKQKIELVTKNKSYTLFIGDISGTSGNYLRIDNENEVYTASGFSDVFRTDDYRDLNVGMVGDETNVNTISFSYPDHELILKKKAGQWSIDNKKVSQDRVDYFLSDLKTLKATDIFPVNTISTDITDFTIKINENGKEKAVSFSQRDENNYLTLPGFSKFVYQIPSAYVTSLMKEKDDFLK